MAGRRIGIGISSRRRRLERVCRPTASTRAFALSQRSLMPTQHSRPPRRSVRSWTYRGRHGRQLEGGARCVPRGEGADGRALRLGDARDGARAPRAGRSRRCPAFLEPEGIPTIRCCSATWQGGGAPSRSAVERGERICVHGDYDVDGICSTALAVATLRELGADVDWHLPSRFEEGYGVCRRDDRALAEAGSALVLTVDCGITAVARSREAPRARPRRDRHRSPPPGRHVARLPDRRHAAVATTRSPSSAARAWRQAGAGAARAQAIPRSRRGISTWSRSRRSPTSCRSSTRTARSRAPGLRRLARTQRPGLRALMRAARVDPRASTRRAVGFRLAPRINAAGRLGRPTRRARAAADRGRDEAARLAHELEALNRERQAVEERDPARGGRADRRLARAARAAARLRRLAGEGWHEGVIGIVASRLVERFGRPVVLIAGEATARGRARAARSDLRPARRPRRLLRTSSASAAIGGRRAVDPPEQLEAFAAAFAEHADAALRRGSAPRHPCRRDRPRIALTLELARSSTQLAPFGLGNPDVTLLVRRLRAGRASRRSATASTSASASGDTGATRQRDRVRSRRPARASPGRVALRRGLQARAEPLERHRLAAARGSAGVRHRRRLRRAAAVARRPLAGGETAWTPEARRVFDELAIEGATCKRQPTKFAHIPGAARARVVHRAQPRAGGGSSQ